MNETSARMIVKHLDVGVLKDITGSFEKSNKFTNAPRQKMKHWMLSVKGYFLTKNWQWTRETNQIVDDANVCKRSMAGWALGTSIG